MPERAAEPVADNYASEPLEEDDTRPAALVVVPRSAELEAAECDLGLALVAIVAGTRPHVSPAMLRDYLATFLRIYNASVRRHDPEYFIVRFSNLDDREAVLRSRIHQPPFQLVWHPWRRTSMATAESSWA
jgi:hypothetical protein